MQISADFLIRFVQFANLLEQNHHQVVALVGVLINAAGSTVCGAVVATAASSIAGRRAGIAIVVVVVVAAAMTATAAAASHTVQEVQVGQQGFRHTQLRFGTAVLRFVVRRIVDVGVGHAGKR